MTLRRDEDEAIPMPPPNKVSYISMKLGRQDELGRVGRETLINARYL
jgi:hypothetical protein